MSVSARRHRDGSWEVEIRALIDGTIYCERLSAPVRHTAAALVWGEKRRQRLLIDGPDSTYLPPPSPPPGAPLTEDELWQMWLFQNGPADCGWIYFVAGPGWAVKIGWAKVVAERISELQIGCPDELVVLGVLRGDRSQEALAHRRFARYHLRGEWFSPGEELMRFVAEHASDWSTEGAAKTSNVGWR